MPHVNQLIDKYAAQGFVVVGVTDEDETKTDAYCVETKSKAIVAYETKGLPSMEAYGFKGLPSAALVGADGNVVWTGHPSSLNAKIIEKALAGASTKPPPEGLLIDVDLPKKFAAIQKNLVTGKLTDGQKALAAALQAKDLADADKTALEAAQKQVDGVIAAENKKAEIATAEKRHFDAQVVWQRLRTHFYATETAKAADASLAAQQADASIKREIEAGAKIAEAQKLAAAGKTGPALTLLATITDGALKDTAEAERAKKIADELKPKK